MSHTLILLAAGVSSRMRQSLAADIPDLDPHLVEEANTLPKCMLSVGTNGRRFIDYLLANAYHAGFRDFIVIVHPNDQIVEAHIRSEMLRAGYVNTSLRIARQYIPEWRTKPFGTGDALYQALTQCPLEDDDFFTMGNTDDLYGAGALRMAQEADSNTIFPYLPSSLGISSEERSRFWLVASDSKGAVVHIVEKPDSLEIARMESENLTLSINMNLVTLRVGDVFDLLAHLSPHPIRDEKEITDIYRVLLNAKNLNAITVQESMPGLTTKADIPKVQAYLATHYPDNVSWEVHEENSDIRLFL